MMTVSDFFYMVAPRIHVFQGQAHIQVAFSKTVKRTLVLSTYQVRVPFRVIIHTHVIKYVKAVDLPSCFLKMLRILTCSYAVYTDDNWSGLQQQKSCHLQRDIGFYGHFKERDSECLIVISSP